MAATRLSLALGPADLTALVADAEHPLVIPCALPAEDPAPALFQAFALLQEALDGLHGEGDRAPRSLRIRVALLPPLCDVRVVSLPPLREEETEAVLRRDAARHFLGSGRPLIVGARRPGGRSAGALPAPVLAAAAPRALVDALQRAVESRGWELERVVPAHAAWLHALEEARGGGDGGGKVRAVVAVVEGTAHVLGPVRGTPERIRRLPAADASAVVEALGGEPASVLLLAEPEARAALSPALTQAAWVVLNGGRGGTSASVAAAAHAGDAEPELVPAPLAWTRRERSRRVTVRMLAASVLTLAAAAAVHLLGQVREYDAVRRERAELKGAVAPALAARDSLAAIEERLEVLRGMGRESARWTFSLVEISVLLPPETHLVSLRAAGDTAVVEAEGGRAGDALAALRTATSLDDVRIEGTIQREIEDGTTSSERFTLSAVLSRRSRAGDGAAAEAPDGGEER